MLRRALFTGLLFAFPLAVQAAPELRIELQEQGIQTSIPAGSQRIPVLGMRLHASCESDVEVYSVALQRRGPGAATDIASVYLMSNGRRISRGRMVERDGMAVIRLRNVIVPACGYKDIDAYVDFAEDAALAGQHWFVLPAGADSFETNADVRIDGAFEPDRFPRTVGGLNTGTIRIEYLDLHRTVRYGSRRVVARFQLEADGENDHLLQSIMLTNDGSATDADLRNLYIGAGLRRVTSIAPQMTGDTVTLTFTPALELDKNQTRLFTLYADVRASRSRTIQFVLEEPSDLNAVRNRGR